MHTSSEQSVEVKQKEWSTILFHAQLAPCGIEYLRTRTCVIPSNIHCLIYLLNPLTWYSVGHNATTIPTSFPGSLILPSRCLLQGTVRWETLGTRFQQSLAICLYFVHNVVQFGVLADQICIFPATLQLSGIHWNSLVSRFLQWTLNLKAIYRRPLCRVLRAWPNRNPRSTHRSAENS